MQGSRLTLRHFVPLVGFVVPTVIMGYGVMIPSSCIAGVNELTVGFAGSIVGACVTYWLGLRALLRERAAADDEA
jgi:membrane protein DedA with SNARE-associated domain